MDTWATVPPCYTRSRRVPIVRVPNWAYIFGLPIQFAIGKIPQIKTFLVVRTKSSLESIGSGNERAPLQQHHTLAAKALVTPFQITPSQASSRPRIPVTANPSIISWIEKYDQSYFHHESVRALAHTLGWKSYSCRPAIAEVFGDDGQKDPKCLPHPPSHYV